MKARILFVDDELHLIFGLRRSLRGNQGNWEMLFAEGSQQALELMGERECDVIVTDIRMPGEDGAELLSQVSKRFPRACRIVLSGQADQQTILRCLPVAHQHFAKPCSISSLQERISKILAASLNVEDVNVRQAIGTMTAIPVMPEAYSHLRDELSTASPSLMVLSEIVASDAGLSARMLQTVNSSFFGIAEETLSTTRAVGRLGVSTLRSLLWDAKIFEPITDERAIKLIKEAVDPEAASVLSIASEETMSKEELIDVAARRLQTLGYHIQAHLRTKQGICPRCFDSQGETSKKDLNQWATYLLGLWGIPDSIVEAVSRRCSDE